MRTLALVVSLLAAAAVAPSLARAGVAHPNPAFVSPQVDYVGPLRAPGGAVATLAPLDSSVTAEAVRDQAWLAYLKRDDLGGFLPAPVGSFALSSGGHLIVGARGRASELPQFAEAASGDVRSFAFVGGGTTTPPDNGHGSVPGLGVPPTVPPPTNSNTAPPPNQGFGGRPTTPPVTTTTTTGAGPGTTTTPGTGTTTTTPTTTTHRPPPTTTTTTTTTPPTTTTPTTTTPTTTAPTTTTTTTTTTATTTTSTTTSHGPAPPPSCGTVGLTITSDLKNCRISAINQAPGDATVEHVTIRNDSGTTFTLSLRVSGATNALWNDLQMGVWEQGTPAPSPLPALLWWTLQENQLTTLPPGGRVRYVIELALPASAGNGDQGLAAVIDLHWHAQA